MWRLPPPSRADGARGNLRTPACQLPALQLAHPLHRSYGINIIFFIFFVCIFPLKYICIYIFHRNVIPMEFYISQSPPTQTFTHKQFMHNILGNLEVLDILRKELLHGSKCSYLKSKCNTIVYSEQNIYSTYIYLYKIIRFYIIVIQFFFFQFVRIDFQCQTV